MTNKIKQFFSSSVADQLGFIFGILLFLQALYGLWSIWMLRTLFFTSFLDLIICFVEFYFAIQWIRFRSSFALVSLFFMPYFFQRLWYALFRMRTHGVSMGEEYVTYQFHLNEFAYGLIAPTLYIFILSYSLKWSRLVPLVLFCFASTAFLFWNISSNSFICLGVSGYLFLSSYLSTPPPRKDRFILAMILITSVFTADLYIEKMQKITYRPREYFESKE